MSHRQGYQETAAGWVPLDWQVRLIGELTEVSAGGTPATTNQAYWNPPEVPWMSSGEIHQRRVYSTEKKISNLGLKNSSAKVFPKKSVVIALAGQGKTRGCVAVLEAEVATNQSLAAIYPSDGFETDFLFHNLDWRYKELRSMSSGEGGRGGLNLAIIKSIPIALPSPAEQQEIAAILRVVDDKLDVIARQLEATRTLKRGLMQTLLCRGAGSQEAGGCWVPHTDFKDSELGRIPVSWQISSIGSLFDVVERAVKMDDTQLYRRVTVKRRYGGIELRDELPGAEIKVKNQFLVEEGDFLISERQIVHGACGVVPSALAGALVSNEYLVLRARKNIDVRYFGYMVQLLRYAKYFLLCSQGVDIEKFLFRPKDWLKKLVPTPPPAEQKRIADVISCAEEKLTALETRHSQFQDLKRGLMQKLLTGEWRIKVDVEEVAA
jgi:type I restriction enzyme, S subunit